MSDVSNDKYIDRFQIIRLLGKGGMGKVYLVKDPQNEQLIALKTLLMQTASGMYRFQREFRAIARLNHPNIVSVYHYGMHDNSPYFTMEYVEGTDLWNYLSEWQIMVGNAEQRALHRLEKTYRVISEICDALHYIHTHGLIHRDLKPGNIMVTLTGQAKLMDFGLAREIDTSMAMTRTGVVIGTLAYMSPEQCRGEKLDHRSDLYSLGIILYEVLCGQLPFGAQNPMDLMMKQIDEDPPAPRQINPDIPPDLEQIILRLLQKESSRRYQTALELRRRCDELASFITGDTLSIEIVSDGESYTPDSFLEPAFVGRTHEKAIFQTLLNRFHADDRKGLTTVLVAGEAGMGKSRLMQEIVRLARMTETKVFIARCFPGENLPYRAFADLMDSMSALLWKKDTAEQRHYVQNDARILARVFSGFNHLKVIQDIPEPEQVSPADERRRLFVSVRKLLARFAQDHPLLIFMDNLQWIDEDAFQLLKYLTEFNPAEPDDHAPIILVGLYRPEEIPGGPFGDYVANRESILDSLIHLELAPLSIDEIQELLQSMLGTDDHHRRFAAWLSDQTGGNPYFIVEIVKDLLQRRILFRKSSQWMLQLNVNNIIKADMTTLEFSILEVPSGIEAIVNRRLEHLSESAHRLLQWAAVAGKGFTYQMLCSLEISETEQLLDDLTDLLRAGIIVERRGQRDDYLEFEQQLVQEVLYRDLSSHRRRIYHRKLAQYYAKLQSSEAEVEALARHWQASDLPQYAPKYLFLAGVNSKNAYAPAQAIQLFTQAIDLLVNPEYQPLIQNYEKLLFYSYSLRGDVYEETGRTALALADYQMLLDIATHSNNLPFMGMSLNKLAIVAMTRGQFRQAVDYNEKSLEIWTQLGDVESQIKCLYNMGIIHSNLGDNSLGIEKYTEALRLAKTSNDLPSQTAILNNLAVLLISMGRDIQASRFIEEYKDLCQKVRDKQGLTRSLSNLGLIHYHLRNSTLANQYFRKGLTLADSIDYPLARAVIRSNQGEFCRFQGDIDHALACHEESLKLARQFEDRSLVSDNLHRIGQDLWHGGQFTKAIRYFAQSIKETKAMEAHGDEILVRYHLGMLLADLNDYRAVRFQLQRNTHLLKKISNPLLEILTDCLRLRMMVIAMQSGRMESLPPANQIIEYWETRLAMIESVLAKDQLARWQSWITIFLGDDTTGLLRWNQLFTDNVANQGLLIAAEIRSEQLAYHCRMMNWEQVQQDLDAWFRISADRKLEPFHTAFGVLQAEVYFRKGDMNESKRICEACLETIRKQARMMSGAISKRFMQSGYRKQLIGMLVQLYIKTGDAASAVALLQESGFDEPPGASDVLFP